jgi:hypothetical protein
MNWIASAFITLLSGALGLVCAGLLASACADWYRVSTFEGAAGYFVVCIAICGGVVGCIIGGITARFGEPATGLGFIKTLGTAAGIELGITGVATVLCWSLADIPPRIDGRLLMVEVELRLPVGVTNLPAADTNRTHVTLGSVVRHVQRKSRQGKLKVAEARLENDRWIVPGEVLLFTMRGHRMINFVMGGQSKGGFIIPLPARPGKKFEQWSKWFPDRRPGMTPWPDTKPSCRFRVQRIIPPPPPPDPEVVEAEKFAALKPDAALSEYIAFLKPSVPGDRFVAVTKVAEQRQAELAQLIRSSDSNVREPALWAVTRFSKITPEVSEAVLAEGREVAAAVGRFNEMNLDDPKSSGVQVELRTRFNYWHRAWWTVHQATGMDGRPPVQEILDLALVHSKETTMDEMVINARAHLDGIKSSPSKSL